MKKGLIVGISFLFILIVLISFVSAGFFSNFWGKITGKVTYSSCIDTDAYAYQPGYGSAFVNGDNPYFKGTFDGSTDSCFLDSLTEYYCYDSGYGYFLKKSKTYNCVTQFGLVCQLGACVSDCSDSDAIAPYLDGKNYYKRGTVTSLGVVYEDYCPLPTYLREQYCTSGGVASSYDFNCASVGMICDRVSDSPTYRTCVVEGTPLPTDCSPACATGYTCTDGFCVQDGATPGCVDTDTGFDIYKAGTVTTSTQSYSDSCITSYLAKCPSPNICLKEVSCNAVAITDNVLYAGSFGGLYTITLSCADYGKVCNFGACADSFSCPNGTCDSSIGETCSNCPGDCGACVSPTTCGDGVKDTGEECDHGNNLDGDGCSHSCVIETGWTCSAGTLSVCTEVTTSCSETDAGFKPYVYGTMTKDSIGYADQCDSVPNILFEFICDSTVSDSLIIEKKQHANGGWYAKVDCPYGCVGGVCAGTSSNTCATCTAAGDYWCNDGQTNCVSSLSQCSDSYYVIVTTAGCTTHHSNFKTCGDCVDKSYTWCKDNNKCVGNTAGCTDKANYRRECGTECVNGIQEYKTVDLSTTSEVQKLIHSLESGCGLSFKFGILNALPSGYTFPSTINRRIVKILNITSDANVQTDIDLILNESELGLKFFIDNVTIYVEEGVASWNPLTGEPTPTSNTGVYTYRFRTNHFSLFLITEPELCGNGVFDTGFEDCDGSVAGVTNCTGCVCDAGYGKNASGFCLQDIGGTRCSPVGNKSCTGYTLSECGSDLKWDNKGKVIGNCSVACYPIGNMSCQGEIPLRCGSDYQWALQSKINGLCGYVSTTPLGYNATSDRCGNGYCNYDEDEDSCPEDCAPENGDGEEPNWFLIALIAGIVILILVIVIVLFKIFSKERRGPMPQPNRNIPPEHRPGPKRDPGRPLEHNLPVGRPPIGGYPVRRYPR